MSDLRIKQMDGYVLFAFTGEHTLDRLVGVAQTVAHECASRECLRSLVDVRDSSGGLSTVEKFELAEIAESLKPRGIRVAILDTPQERADGFLETTASNRAIALKLFFNEDQAVAWLQQKAQRVGSAVSSTSP